MCQNVCTIHRSLYVCVCVCLCVYQKTVLKEFVGVVSPWLPYEIYDVHYFMLYVLLFYMVVFFFQFILVSFHLYQLKSPVPRNINHMALQVLFFSKLILPFSSQNAEAIMSRSINPTFWHFTLEEEFSCQAITASEPQRHKLWACAYTKP